MVHTNRLLSSYADTQQEYRKENVEKLETGKNHAYKLCVFSTSFKKNSNYCIFLPIWKEKIEYK